MCLYRKQTVSQLLSYRPFKKGLTHFIIFRSTINGMPTCGAQQYHASHSSHEVFYWLLMDSIVYWHIVSMSQNLMVSLQRRDILCLSQSVQTPDKGVKLFNYFWNRAVT